MHLFQLRTQSDSPNVEKKKKIPCNTFAFASSTHSARLVCTFFPPPVDFSQVWHRLFVATSQKSHHFPPADRWCTNDCLGASAGEGESNRRETSRAWILVHAVSSPQCSGIKVHVYTNKSTRHIRLIKRQYAFCHGAVKFSEQNRTLGFIQVSPFRILL